ncbi:glucose-induced degradation protein 8 homolog [Bolinopsis microptera]|uniref:glucose-induced degradation protein 8 homolog n=1 Tax=Bolinopsis microptera TaxID=2820187 RepID=UPI00307AC517
MDESSNCAVWMSRLETLPLSRSDMNTLVMDYLVTEGYKDAAQVFMDEAGVQSPINLESMSDRIKIREAMDLGNIDLVTQMINDFDPELLDMKPTLYFHLQQQKLIELIRSKNIEEALLFAQTELAPHGEDHPEVLAELEKTMSLFAFSEPENCPFGDLLKPSQKHKVAGELNSAVLESQNQQTTTNLHTLLKILHWSQDMLTQQKVSYPKMEDISSGIISNST